MQTNNLIQDYFNFHAHFVAWKQLFVFNFWGYGGSYDGTKFDGLSFAVGYVQSAGLVLLPALLLFFKKKVNRKFATLGILFWVLSLVNIFMTSNKSVLIWNNLPFLAYVQFPWRFLGMVAVCTATVFAFATDLLPAKIKNYSIVFTIVLLFVLNFNFYRFEKYQPGSNDTTELTGARFEKLQASGLSDYLPYSSKAIPQEIAPPLPQTTSSRVNVNYFDKRSNYFASEFDVYEDNVTITFPTVYFPGWQIFHNRLGNPYPITYDNNLGLITVKLNKGHHVIQGFFENTTSRTIGNILTFISAAGILLLYVLDKHET